MAPGCRNYPKESIKNLEEIQPLSRITMNVKGKHPMVRLIPGMIFMFALLSVSTVAEAGITRSGCAGNNPQALLQASNRNGAYVHPSAVNTFKCILNGFENIRVPIAWIGGYGCRPLRTSNHPRGLAIDINQYARDKTKPVVPRQPGVQIANRCNATSGAVWRNPDNGHFEIRSASRSQQKSKRKHSSRRSRSY